MGKKNKPKKLNIFDFDGTLVKSPIPETGKVIYKEKTGEPWKHIGWWSKPESLDLSVFDIPVIDKTIEDYKSIIKNSDNLTIMATGRQSKLSDKVETILDFHNLDFDDKFYNTGGATLDVKLKQFSKILDAYPSIDEVNIWEDRINHAKSFVEWGNVLITKGVIKTINVNVVSE